MLFSCLFVLVVGFGLDVLLGFGLLFIVVLILACGFNSVGI